MALDAHLAAVDERIAALEDAQANAPTADSAAATTRPFPSTLWLSRSASTAADERMATVDERVAAVDERLQAVDERVAALEDAVESVDRVPGDSRRPANDHLTSPVSMFPHVWVRTGSTLSEEFLQVHFAENLWHFEFEAACSSGICRHVPEMVVAPQYCSCEIWSIIRSAAPSQSNQAQNGAMSWKRPAICYGGSGWPTSRRHLVADDRRGECPQPR